jgi:hypothetical protein
MSTQNQRLEKLLTLPSCELELSLARLIDPTLGVCTTVRIRLHAETRLIGTARHVNRKTYFARAHCSRFAFLQVLALRNLIPF